MLVMPEPAVPLHMSRSFHKHSALYETESVTKLVLAACDISDSGWEALAAALKVNTSIRALK